MTTLAEAPPAGAPPRPARRGNPIVRALKRPVIGRITFPLVCLAIWLISLEVVGSIWPFAVDVLPHPL
jgi:hypothetical protein